MPEYKYVELPNKGLTGSRERQAAVNAELAPFLGAGWEPVSIAPTGALGTVGFVLRHEGMPGPR